MRACSTFCTIFIYSYDWFSSSWGSGLIECILLFRLVISILFLLEACNARTCLFKLESKFYVYRMCCLFLRDILEILFY